jgi:rhamnosyltransferase
VVPVYRLRGEDSFRDFSGRLSQWRQGVDLVVLVDNNPTPDPRLDRFRDLSGPGVPVEILRNGNRGGLAGGFNLGIRAALSHGATLITLLDQDSELSSGDLRRLEEPWRRGASERLVVGPMVFNVDSGRLEAPAANRSLNYVPSRLLISSGTTFRSADSDMLGPLHEGLFIDFLDHAWCFRARRKGFRLLRHPGVVMRQRFGHPHPHPLCRRLGMHLYSPRRHYFALRNLRWLCLQREVPADLKIKEVIKMLFKPWLWLLCEPGRRDNARAIWAGLTCPLPGPHP